MASTNPYRVLQPVKHNGVVYQSGNSISLTDKQAEVLGNRVILQAPSATTAPLDALSATTLGKLTVPELTDYATARKIVVPANSTKDQIIALLVPAGS